MRLLGLLFVLSGGLFASRADSYGIGSSAHMGAGFFPYYAGIALAVVGVVLVFQQTPSMLQLRLRPLAFVVVSLIAFSMAVERSFVLATLLLLVGAYLADER